MAFEELIRETAEESAVEHERRIVKNEKINTAQLAIKLIITLYAVQAYTNENGELVLFPKNYRMDPKTHKIIPRKSKFILPLEIAQYIVQFLFDPIQITVSRLPICAFSHTTISRRLLKRKKKEESRCCAIM